MSLKFFLFLCVTGGLISFVRGADRLPPEVKNRLSVWGGGQPKTPWDSECHDDDPLGCPRKVERGECFGIINKGLYKNGSLDLSKSAKIRLVNLLAKTGNKLPTNLIP